MIFGTGTKSVVEEDYWCWQCAARFFPSNKFPSLLEGFEGLYVEVFVLVVHSCTCHVVFALVNSMVEGALVVGFLKNRTSYKQICCPLS